MPRHRFLLPITLVLAVLCALQADEPARDFDEELFRDAGLQTDGPALVEFLRKRTLSEDDKAKLPNKVRLLGSRSFQVREKTAAELTALGPVVRPYLKAAVNDADPEIARRAGQCLQVVESSTEAALPYAAARLLAKRRPTGAAEAILNYLPQVEEELLEEELLASLAAVGLRDGQAQPALPAALKDRSAVRRAAAARVLGAVPQTGHRDAVRSLLRDADSKVRLRAAQGLIAGKDRQALPALVALLRDAPLPIAFHAEELLCRIAGDRCPPVWLASGKDEERQKCHQGWEVWWREHGARIDLATVDLEQRFLGLTMICTCDGYNRNKGRVWEIGPDRKVRWEINDVAYPVDAQMLPGNRVLIAEQQARCLTERDLKGKVLWKHPVNGNVVGCQRLRNGNTFVVTNNLLYEITPAQKVIATYPGHRGTVYAGLKLRNGNVVYLSSTYLFTELDPRGKELRSFKVDMAGIGLVKPEELPDGRFLIGQRKELLEVDGTGKAHWQGRADAVVSAQRLPNGNTLAASDLGHRVLELDRTGKIVWEERLKGGPVRTRRR